jgi:hypothetical protein
MSRTPTTGVPKSRNAKRQNPINRPSQGVMWTVDPTPFQSFRNREMEMSRTPTIGVPKVANPEITIYEIMKRSGPSNHLECGPLIRLHFGASDIGTWSVKRLYHRSAEIPKCEMRNTFWLNLWSQPLVTSAEDEGRS